MTEAGTYRYRLFLSLEIASNLFSAEQFGEECRVSDLDRGHRCLFFFESGSITG